MTDITLGLIRERRVGPACGAAVADASSAVLEASGTVTSLTAGVTPDLAELTVLWGPTKLQKLGFTLHHKNSFLVSLPCQFAKLKKLDLELQIFS